MDNYIENVLTRAADEKVVVSSPSPKAYLPHRVIANAFLQSEKGALIIIKNTFA